jgi:hypothetical protein
MDRRVDDHFRSRGGQRPNVTLTTSGPRTASSEYSITVSNVTDLAAMRFRQSHRAVDWVGRGAHRG